jgi:multidrug transporter EmrE-like cation transporter
MSPQQLLLVGAGVYLVYLCAAVYFTRATARRVLGALVGGVAVAAVGYGVELACQALGLWYYPSDDTGRGPLLMYPSLAFLWATLALIGWRVVRRFGWRGEVVFLAAVALLGTLRDYFVGQALGGIVLAPGVTTVLVEIVCWAGQTALTQALMWLVAGPAAADRLARRRWESAEPGATADRPRDQGSMAYVYLAIAIVGEVVATSALKAAESFTKPLPSLLVVVGYGVAFYFLSVCLKSISVGVAYAMWSGLGVVLVTVAAAILYQQVPDVWAVVGMALIVAGVLVLNLLSKSVAH